MLLCLSASGAGFAADDDYLKALEIESSKLETRNQEGGTEQQDKTASTQENNEAAKPDVRDKFEKILDEKYHGSYVFYSKLPERSRQEIVNDYEQGMSFTDVRKKIIDRFLQR
jgi:hypothetical protein